MENGHLVAEELLIKELTIAGSNGLMTQVYKVVVMTLRLVPLDREQLYKN